MFFQKKMTKKKGGQQGYEKETMGLVKYVRDGMGRNWLVQAEWMGRELEEFGAWMEKVWIGENWYWLEELKDIKKKAESIHTIRVFALLAVYWLYIISFCLTIE